MVSARVARPIALNSAPGSAATCAADRSSRKSSGICYRKTRPQRCLKNHALFTGLLSNASYSLIGIISE